MSKVICVTMARMSSGRLPGKTLMDVEGRPLFEYHLKRLQSAKKIDEIIVATTQNKADDILAEYCNNQPIKCFRGSEEDVLSRYYHCAELLNADLIVRVTGDCPLIDPTLIDQVVDHFENQTGCDYAHLDVTKFPRGFDCEIFTREALEQAHHEAMLPYEREHVTSFIYNHPERYKISTFSMEKDYSNLRFCVDEIDDLTLIREIAQYFGDKIFHVSWQNIIEEVLRHPDWEAINRNVAQRKAES